MFRFTKTPVNVTYAANSRSSGFTSRHVSGYLGGYLGATRHSRFYSTEERPAFIEGTEEDTSSTGSDSNPALAPSKPVMIWFNSLFPISTSLFDPRGFLAKTFVEEMKTTLYSTLLPPPSQQPFPLVVTKTIPNIKEGEHHLHGILMSKVECTCF